MKISSCLLVFSLFLLTIGCDNYTGIVPASSPTTADSTPPTVSTPLNITVEASGTNGTAAVDAAIATFLSSASASDASGISSFTHNAPAAFPLGTTTVIFSYTDTAGNTGTGTATVTVVDTTAPVINLNTTDLLVVTLGTTFSDPVTATDAADNALSINITGTIDTAVAGSYTLTYNVTDASGNTAATVTRTVVVNTPPIATGSVLSTHIGTNITATLQASDADAGTALSLRITALPVDGMLYHTSDGVTLGVAVTTTDTLTAGAQVIYVPNAALVGQNNFTFVANDGNIDSAIATITIDVTNTAPVAGMNNGSALSFDGVDDYIAIGAPDLDGFPALTLEAWINPITTTAGAVISKYDNTNNVGANGGDSYYMNLRANGLLRFFVETSQNNWAYVDSPTNTIQTGQWNHVAGVWNGNANFTLYVNGSPVTTTLVQTGNLTTMENNTSPVNIGRLHAGSAGNPGDFFDGQIDDARIWNTARTQAEIQANMNTQLAGNESGLVGYWKFNEGSGTAASDSTINNNNGSLGNGVAAAQPTWATSAGSPQVDPGAVNTRANTSTTVFLGGSDADGDALAFTRVSGLPVNGSLFQTSDGTTPGAAIALNDDVTHADGQVIYVPDNTPNNGFVGSDALNFLVNDGFDDSTTATIDINVANTAPIAGAMNSALSFDGVNDYINVPLANAPTYTTQATVELWFNSSSAAQQLSLQNLANLGLAFYQNRFTAGDIVFAFDASTLNESTGFGSGLNDGQWHHAAGVHDNGTLSIYVDGQLVGTKTEALITGSTGGAIGINGVTLTSPTNGFLDDVRVWNTARTQAQIQANMHRPLSGSESGLVGHWKLDEGSGTAANDSTANANNGTLGAGVVAQQPTWTLPASAPASTVLAPTVTVSTNATANKAIYLGGYDADGHALTLRITALPTNGSLFQTIDGTTPVGTAITVGTDVTHTDGIVIFNSTTAGSDTFSFIANDGFDNSNTATLNINVIGAAL